MPFSLHSLRFRRAAQPDTATEAYTSDSEPSVIHDGNLAYLRTVGGNGSKPAYQEAVGAPVEVQSPLGYHVGWITVIFLNINQMIGTGIFSTRELCPVFWSGGLRKRRRGRLTV
jgi:hypothetical protein